MAIDIVDLPIKEGVFPLLCGSLPEGIISNQNPQGSTSPKPSPIKPSPIPSISFTCIHPHPPHLSMCPICLSGGVVKTKTCHPNDHVRISIWLFNSSPWKIHPFYPFLSSVNHLFLWAIDKPWRTVSHNQRVDDKL